jgi:Na+/H+ antiporter NhaD/arsenite permease-like protein
VVQEASEWIPRAWFGLNPMWVATGILAATYIAVMTERVNRAIVAGIGACLMIVVGILNQDAAIRGVDFNTIMLLAGMMLLVGITKRTGVFEYLAIWSAKKVKAHPAGILVSLAVATAFISSLLDNVTTVLLVVPVTMAITRELKIAPYPFLFAEVMASNIGGTATLIGDPPNIMIGSAAHLTFNDFVVNLTPVIIVVLIAQSLALHLMWGKKMKATDEDRARVMAMNERELITDPILLRHCLTIMGVVLLAFILARVIHLEPGTIAMFGAAILILLDNWPHPAEHQTRKVTASFGDVEWITLFFFIGLFVVVAGVERTGLISKIARWVLDATHGSLTLASSVILWSSAVLSAVVDNIPFVAAMIPLIREVGPQLAGGEHLVNVLWWSLSLGACLGGNGTLIGASANLTVAGLAERQGVKFGFWTYTKTAFWLMLMSIVICQAYLFVRYL